MTHQIAFPGLGLSWEIHRVAFSVGKVQIYWYGLLICLGFCLAMVYVSKQAPRYGVERDTILDGALWGVPFAIVGARAYYVIFQWEAYQNNPIEALQIWNGGLAFYGGMLGAMLGVWIYTKRKQLSFVNIADLIAPGFLIGQCIGRFGNFVNAEAFGGMTDLPWRMEIDGAIGVHPTFFYEALWNAIGFLVLHFLSKHRRFTGQIALSYLAWYGFGRMLIEGLRADSLYIGHTGLRVSQVLAGVTFLISSILLVRGYRNHRVYAVPTEYTPPTPKEEEQSNT